MLGRLKSDKSLGLDICLIKSELRSDAGPVLQQDRQTNPNGQRLRQS